MGVNAPLGFLLFGAVLLAGAYADNTTEAPRVCPVGVSCKDGILIPMWEPVKDVSTGDTAARATVYFIAIIFMFLGVGIISDRFMASIEVITSKEREVTIHKPNGETAVVHVRVWNETVSNLTLMALGSSAPEIMLSVIEVCGNKFEAGDLGPGTIVGSAAFNLFVIIGLCVQVIPDGEVRRIKHLRVFFITATLSVFAYLWLYMIIAVISYGEVEIWEGLLTLAMFPFTVGLAYIADRRIFFYKFLNKKYRSGGAKGTIVATEGGDIEMEGVEGQEGGEVAEFERHRREYMEIMREIRKKNPNIDMKELEEKAEYEVMNRGPKSRAFYRIQATRKLTGGGNVAKKKKEKDASMDKIKVDAPDDDITRIFFEPGHYTVMENVGAFACTVSRQGGNCNNTVYVDYRTEDGTASAGSDYEYAEGTLVFHPGETSKSFHITVIDDDVFEEDEHFYIRLSNLRSDDDGSGQKGEAQLANPSMATVMILDDDHAGIFHFEQGETSFPESIGEAGIKICRSSGARGKVKIPYRTIEGTAKAGKDFEEAEGEMTFHNDECEGYIKVRIHDDEEYEKNEVFYIELGEPRLIKTASDEEAFERFRQKFLKSQALKEEIAKTLLKGGKPDDLDEKAIDSLTEEEKIAQLGKPKLGEVTKITCHIRESLEFKSTVDKLLKKANVSLVVGTSSWREQFIEAVTVSAGDDDDGGDDEGEEGEEAEEVLPSCMDYVMHFLTIFWKIMFAFVPPTDYWGGWACFTVSILLIGGLTAVIGDLASQFGCTIGLKDAVNAISFVALGTSLPDTFASKVAALNDEYADGSVGNVTGSNAVNVFLGIGIAWSIAAIYHAANNSKFEVTPGSLAFSVTVFCCFAFACIAIMLLRRMPFIGGELGGPKKWKVATSTVFIMFWVMYVLLASLESYCHIKGF